jgi:hypothetical protein
MEALSCLTALVLAIWRFATRDMVVRVKRACVGALVGSTSLTSAPYVAVEHRPTIVVQRVQVDADWSTSVVEHRRFAFTVPQR